MCAGSASPRDSLESWNTESAAAISPPELVQDRFVSGHVSPLVHGDDGHHVSLLFCHLFALLSADGAEPDDAAHNGAIRILMPLSSWFRHFGAEVALNFIMVAGVIYTLQTRCSSSHAIGSTTSSSQRPNIPPTPPHSALESPIQSSPAETAEILSPCSWLPLPPAPPPPPG